MFFNLVNFIISILFTLILIKFSRPYLLEFLLVQPNDRSSHTKAKPTGTGIVFVLVSLIASFFYNKFIVLICIPLAIIGFIDDLKGLNFIIRYFFQFLTGILLIYNSNFLKIYISDENLFFMTLAYLFLSFLATSIINFANFADGIDGLLASIMIIIFSLSALHNIGNSFIWGLVGALIAFLFFNWQPSKLFMGDAGSTFLGAVFFGIMFNSDNLKEILLIILPVIPLFTDTFITVLRRFFAGENIFEAHSLHLFQRLYKAGWSHSKITIFYMTATFVLGIFSLVNSWFLIITSICLIFYTGFYLDQKIAVPFNLALRKNK